MQNFFFSNQPHNVIFFITISSSVQMQGLTQGSEFPWQLWVFIWFRQGTFLSQA